MSKIQETASLDSVNTLLKTVEQTYVSLGSKIDLMDNNLVADMNVLVDKQVDTIEAVNELTKVVVALVATNETLVNVVKKRPSTSKTVVVVAFVVGGYVGYSFAKSRKANKNG